MKHILLFLVGLGIAFAVAFVVMREEAISPNGSLTSPAASELPEPRDNITVLSPKPGETVNSPVTVNGMARTFEQNVQWRLTDAGSTNQLASGFTTATSGNVGQFGPYQFVITVPAGAPRQLMIEVYESSAEDGMEINKVSVPVTLQ